MPAIGLLRAAYNVLGTTQIVHQAVHPEHLALQAYRHEFASGTILNPRRSTRATYLPYAAARPVAAMTRGARKAGFAASAWWGASVATSCLRTDGPVLGLYCLMYFDTSFGARRPQRRPQAAAQDHTSQVKKTLVLLQQVALILPYTLCLSEALFGTGAPYEALAPRAEGGRQRSSVLETAEWQRRIGALGFLEHRLLAQATPDRRGSTAGFEAAALGVRALAVPGRLINGAILAATAVLGACMGLAYEAVAQLMFALQRRFAQNRGGAQVVATAEAEAQEQADRLMGLRMLDDTQLPAPLIVGLWQPHERLARPGGNVWVEAGARYGQRFHAFRQEAAFGPERGRGHQGPALRALFAAAAEIVDDRPQGVPPMPGAFPQPEAQRRPPMPGAFPQPEVQRRPPMPAQDAARAARVGVDVHAEGRDVATRQAVTRLFSLYPQVDETAAINDLTQQLERHNRARHPLALRQHDMGIPTLEAAQRALGTAGAVPAGGYPAILSTAARHSVYMTDGSLMPVRRVCATVWHAIGRLKEGDGGDERRNMQLRQERRDAFIVAVADVINTYGDRVCAPGQVQRMVLVLQGCLEGINVENYELVPSVPQMVSYVYQQIATDLAEDASPRQIRARFDRAYADGIVRLPEPQHTTFAQQLSALAQMDHDVDWAPQARAA